MSQDLAQATIQIHELLQQLQNQDISVEDATQKAASDLAKQAKENPTLMGKLVNWGKSLSGTAEKEVVSEVAKGVIKLALQMLGIPIP